MSAELVAVLSAELGPRRVSTDPETLAARSRDLMPLVPSGTPLAVVSPADEAGVSACVRACAAAGVPIVPRGGGTGLTGAANAVDGCVVLSTAALDRIVEIDADNRLAVVQASVVTADLRAAAARRGLFYAPDPSSRDSCTVGGNLATNAGGLCCVKYGVTADAVLGLRAVLADGSVLRAGRRTVKGVAGYDLARLLVGSEGTLGVITEATVALRPLPAAPSTLVASFDATEQVGAAVVAVVRAGVVPSLMEVMDAISLRAVEAYLGVALGSRALLLCQTDSGGDAGRRELAALARIFREAGAAEVRPTDDPAEGEALLHARRVSLPALEAQGRCLTEDVCVPRTRVADLITGCAGIGDEVGLRVAVVGHAGDGNMHPTVLYEPGAEARAQWAFDAILDLGLALGGTITGEHGVGRLKRDWLVREIGPVGTRVHEAIKAAFDPNGLFNPGAVLPG